MFHPPALKVPKLLMGIGQITFVVGIIILCFAFIFSFNISFSENAEYKDYLLVAGGIIISISLFISWLGYLKSKKEKNELFH